MKRNRNRLLPLILILAALVLAISSWYLYNDYQTAAQSDEQMDIKPEDDAIDFDALWEINPDITAWLKIDGTQIDHPVAQGKDNAYYLTHTAERQVNRYGALFMDYRCSRDFSDFNTVIYGHNMRSGNGKMFGCLQKFREKAFFDAHRTGMLYTPEGTFQLDISAVVAADALSDFYSYIFESPAKRQEHLDMIQARALLRRDAGITADDRILTLSTCSYEYANARTLVIAKINGTQT